MKLGIIAAPAEKSFISAQKRGLQFLEFCLNAGKDPSIIDYTGVNTFCEKVDEIKGWTAEYGVEVGSIGTWGFNRINKDGSIIADELEASCRLIDAASRLGCKNYVCGCNYVDQLSYYQNCTAAIEFFSKLMEYASGKGVRISSYNCRWNNFVHSPMAWTVIHGHLKELGIKFDPSHTRYDGGDYLKEMEDWGDRFYHVHIKGSLVIDGKRFDDPPAGMDQTDWGSFMAVLYAKKYQEGLSIEPHSANWRGELGEKGVDYTIEYIRRMMF